MNQKKEIEHERRRALEEAENAAEWRAKKAVHMAQQREMERRKQVAVQATHEERQRERIREKKTRTAEEATTKALADF